MGLSHILTSMRWSDGMFVIVIDGEGQISELTIKWALLKIEKAKKKADPFDILACCLRKYLY